MPDYDFRSLSSVDFERFVRDALQAELQIRLESFKAGTDHGIDLRHAFAPDASVIVQCKHFVESGFARLLRHVMKSERSKVEKLSPARYLLATSVPLSPGNKRDLLEALSPFCKSSSDIFGKDDLNNIIGRHPEIERANHKLWLTSSKVLKAILHSRVYNFSDLAVDKIQQKIRLYVQNESFDESKKLLKRNRVCVISGIPGIGKTMLAEMLLIEHLADGFEAFKISEDVDEAIAVSDLTRKQIFYYDDFLGQSAFTEKLGKNEDDRLISFIERTQRTKNHRFVLTTREYILNQAKRQYEKLANSNLDLTKCTIDLGKYTRLNKAQILFNHVYFSPQLGDPHRASLLRSKTYARIVDHKNLSPRIIEWMTSFFQPTTGSDFGRSFLENLDNPNRVWLHAFENQITEVSRHALLVTASLPSQVSLEDYEAAFNSFRAVQSRKTASTVVAYANSSYTACRRPHGKRKQSREDH